MEDEAFQVAGFGDGKKDRVISGLGAALQHAEGASGGERCRGNEFQQGGFREVMGAGAGDEHTSGRKEFERFEVDFAVGAEGGIEVGAGLGEGGRIEDDPVELAARGVEAGEVVEGVGLAPFDVADGVEAGVFDGQLERGGRGVDRLDGLAAGSGMESEAAGGGEQVEAVAAGPAGSGDVVFALIEKNAGLLPVEGIDEERESVHADLDARRRLAVKDARFEGELLEASDGDVIAGDDGGGVEQFEEAVEDEGRGAVHALIEELDGEMAGVVIDDKGGQQVGLAVDKAPGVRPGDEAGAKVERGAEAIEEESAVDEAVFAGEEAETDLGGGGEMGDA